MVFMNTLIFSILLSFLICSLTGMIIIPIFKKLKLGQNIKDTAPKTHKKKSGVPTFGGIIFIFSSIITMLFFHWGLSQPFKIQRTMPPLPLMPQGRVQMLTVKPSILCL